MDAFVCMFFQMPEVLNQHEKHCFAAGAAAARFMELQEVRKSFVNSVNGVNCTFFLLFYLVVGQDNKTTPCQRLLGLLAVVDPTDFDPPAALARTQPFLIIMGEDLRISSFKSHFFGFLLLFLSIVPKCFKVQRLRKHP